MNKPRKWYKYVILIIIAAIAIYGIINLVRLGTYKKAVANMTFSTINLNEISDGTYTGSCDVDYISATVQVTVKDHVITDITLLKHYNDKGAAAEAITDKMIATQSTDVDVITGATNSSKVIRKAVENALLSSITD